jgi:hypothetical protein
MKLNNIESDKILIQDKLLRKEIVRGIFSLGIFTSVPKAMSFTTQEFNGTITKIDLNSGYIEWVNERGLRMPVVNINSFELLSEE